MSSKGGILGGKLQGDVQHAQGKHRHPGCAVALLDLASVGQEIAPVEDPHIVHPEKTAFEDVVACLIHAVSPPCIAQQELVEGALEILAVAFPFIPRSIE